jgi:hypothetical protein
MQLQKGGERLGGVAWVGGLHILCLWPLKYNQVSFKPFQQQLGESAERLVLPILDPLSLKPQNNPYIAQ